jgi:CRISPR/Cas system-associated protein Cas7 (RAMP superfamily)
MEREPLREEAYDGAPSDNSSMALEDAIIELYKGSKCTKLVATILLMNLCIVHGVSNKFANELFTFLHLHLLLGDNCLLNNYYVAKTLTKRLGLDCKCIHACNKGVFCFEELIKIVFTVQSVKRLITRMKEINYLL